MLHFLAKYSAPRTALTYFFHPKKATDYQLRNSESSYVLLQCKLENFENSFVNMPCETRYLYISLCTFDVSSLIKYEYLYE